MHFYLPRRHRRKLLFPPGLLALAGLQWLCCVAVRPWQDRLNKKVVMQLAVLPLHLRLGQYDNIEPVLLQPPVKFQSFRHWVDASLQGRAELDYPEEARITKAVQAMMADSVHSNGVRIRFTSTARYKNLVFALDLMHREKVIKYWLDVRGKPTLYAYTYVRLRASQGGITELVCGTPYYTRHVLSYIPPPAPLWDQFDAWLTNFWSLTWLQPLQKAEWQASIWLLAAIAAISSWRMVRARRAF